MSIFYYKNIFKKINTICITIGVVKNWASDTIYIRTTCMYDLPISDITYY